MADIKFVDGLRIFKPRDNAPEWIKGSLVIDANILIPWIQANAAGDGSIEIDIKPSKDGKKWYCTKNDYVAKPKEAEPLDSVDLSDSTPF